MPTLSSGQTPAEAIDQIYQHVLRRDADSSGLSSFGAQFVTGITSVNLDDVALGIGGFKIAGEIAGDQAGYSVSSAGDVNGDGFADIIVGAKRNEAGGSSAGAAYVVFGAATRVTSVNLDDVALGIGGFKITGENAGDLAARSVSSAGDVNGDGFADLIVGAAGGVSIGVEL